MRQLRVWFLRLAGLFNKERRDRELAEEIESHLEMHIEDNLRRGMTPEEARREALIKLGGIEQTKESYRERRGLPMLETLMQDLRFGVRMLCKNPGFTAVAVLTLALSIGANTAIFSVVKAVLLEPLPYHEPDRLVHIIQNLLATQTIDARPRRVAAMELNEFLEFQRRTQTLSHTAAYDTHSEMTLSGREEPIRLVGTPVSASLFPTLGTQPLVGRGFFADEEKPGSQRTVVLSYPAWQKYFASDPNTVNRIITLDGRGYLVAGVMPRGFEFPDRLTEFWLPLNLTPPGRDEIKTVTPLGRLKDGIAIETAAAEANTILGDVHRSYPPDRVIALGKLEVVAVKDELVRPVQPALVVLTVAVGFVLLIACSNVANLLLARGAARQGERAIRAALGASRGRLICQTLTESSLLGIMGGAAGCVLAVGGVRLLRSLGPGSVPRLEGIGIDVTVLAFTFALSMFTGLLFGLIPAFHLSRVSQMEIIKTSAGTKSSERQRTRSLIVIAEMGMAVVLLIGGALLIRSFMKLSNVNPGFDPSNVLAFQVALPRPLNLNALNESLTQEFLSRLQSLPGVKSVGFANALPLVPRYGFSQPRIQGTPIPVQGVPEFREVSRNYLSAMGLRLLAGRSFGESDGPGQPQVAIVSKAIVPYFGGETPIGKTITLAGNPAEIVGIVDDIREQALNLEPRPQVYIDSRQSLARSRNAQALNWAYFVVRSDRTPTLMIPNVRSILRQMIPGATLKLNVAIMEDIISNSIARPRLYAVLLGVFGGVAVLLAMIGVYGITTYSVAQRTREIGIRIALGAQPWEVLFLALRQSVILATIGILLGLGGAAAVTRYLEAMLFGLTPLDPTTFVAASVAFGFTAVLASYLPARRATKVDPMAALRYE